MYGRVRLVTDGNTPLSGGSGGDLNVARPSPLNAYRPDDARTVRTTESTAATTGLTRSRPSSRRPLGRGAEIASLSFSALGPVAHHARASHNTLAPATRRVPRSPRQPRNVRQTRRRQSAFMRWSAAGLRVAVALSLVSWPVAHAAAWSPSGGAGGLSGGGTRGKHKGGVGGSRVSSHRRHDKMDLNVGMLVPKTSFGVRGYLRAIHDAMHGINKAYKKNHTMNFSQLYDFEAQNVRYRMMSLTPSPTGWCTRNPANAEHCDVNIDRHIHVDVSVNIVQGQ